MGKAKKRRFFKQDTTRGLVKRMMYKKYLQAYIAKTQNEKFNLRTIIIDGFAGPGRYSDGWPEEIEKYGSPLIALMVALNFLLRKVKRLANKTSSDSELTEKSSTSEACLAESRTDEQETPKVTSWISAVNLTDEELEKEAKSCRQNGSDNNTDIHDITLICIEDDKEYYRNLVNNIERLLVKFLKSHLPTCQYKYCESGNEGLNSTTFSLNIPLTVYSFEIQVHNRKFGTYEPPRELEAGCTRSLTFLDPFDYKSTPMDHVKKFAPGEGNEIFINFMSGVVADDIREKGNDKDIQKHIRDLYGFDESDLAGFLKDRGNVSKCAEVYEHNLKKKTQTAYSQSFEVRKKNDDIIYHLIHITNHIRGIEAMKVSMKRCSQRKGEMVMSDFDIVQKGHKLNFGNLYDKLNFGNLDDHDVVADKIFKKFKGKQDVLLEPSAQESNDKLKSSRNYGTVVYNCNPTVKEFVVLDTKFLYRKKSIATLQRQGKIIKVVDENRKPQKRKYSFPEKDSKTKNPKKWYVSFANEAPEPDYTYKTRQSGVFLAILGKGPLPELGNFSA